MARARSDAQPRLQAASGSGNARRNLVRFLSLSAALLACSAWAAKWDIVPTLSVAGTYTDNLSLTPDALKQSDWVTQIIPGISISGTGDRLRLNIAYAPQLTYYARAKENNQVFQTLSATGNAELAKQLLFVDAGASVAQNNISLQGPLTANNVNTTGNRTTTTAAFASPYLIHDFGSAVRAEARFTYSVTDYSDDALESSNSVADRINLRLASGRAFRLLTWDLAYSKENISYSDRRLDIGSEVSLANARLLITATVGLLASVGYEEYTNTIGRGSEGRFWNAGFDWAPSPRTHLVATAGERFYDDRVYFLDFNHRTRLTTWSAGYSQTITTTRNEFFIPASTSTAGYLDTLFSSRFPDPVTRQKAVEEFIARTGLPPSLNAPVNVFVNTRFLQKRWGASAGIVGIRNVLIASVFDQTREGLAGNEVLPNAPNASKQTGASLLWNLRMTVRSAWNLGAFYGRNEIPNTGEIGNLTYVVMGLTRQFQPRLSGALNYRRQHNDSNFDASDYTENAVIATLQMRF